MFQKERTAVFPNLVLLKNSHILNFVNFFEKYDLEILFCKKNSGT